ncbi:hypothetical protein BST61_g2524 [Cercospora zeina]
MNATLRNAIPAIKQPVAQKVQSNFTQMAEQAEEHSKTSFLDLPAELRNNIYRLCLVAPGSVHIIANPETEEPRIDAQTTFANTDSSLFAPGLLRSCKQIKHEAISILYGENVFHIQDLDVGRPFFLQITGSVRHIRDVSLRSAMCYKTTMMRLLPRLREAPKLRKLTLEFDVGLVYSGSPTHVEQAARSLGPLMRHIWRQRKPIDKNEVLDIVHWTDAWRGQKSQQAADQMTAKYRADVKAVIGKTLK